MRLKGMERRLKAAAIRMLARVVPVPRRGERPDWSARPHRVLYLRYDRIGDMILATGIIEAIAAAQPTVTVDVLASPANAVVLDGNPHVHEVLTFDKKRPWTFPKTVARVRRAHYDAVLDAMVLSPSLTTVLLMWASGARHRIGVAGRGNEFALTVGVPRARHAVHYVDHSAALLSAFGVDPQPRERREAREERRDQAADARGPATHAVLDAPAGGWGLWKPRLYLTDDELAAGERHWEALSVGRGREPGATWRLAANVSAGDQTRYWPEDRFIETLTWLREAHPDVSVLIIGAPQDGERIGRIARGAGVPAAHTPRVRDMMGRGGDGRHRVHGRHVGHARRVGVRHAGGGHVSARSRRAVRAVWHQWVRRVDAWADATVAADDAGDGRARERGLGGDLRGASGSVTSRARPVRSRRPISLGPRHGAGARRPVAGARRTGGRWALRSGARRPDRPRGGAKRGRATGPARGARRDRAVGTRGP